MAWSHLIRVHWPPTSFSGYLSRRSPETSSRTAAPLAQCEPRLIGLSQLGSWPIQTPFATSAITVQPTEQCVQTFFRVVTVVPGAGGGPASALRPAPIDKAPSAARLPAVRPERCRKLRRSRPPLAGTGSPATRVLRRASRCVLL